MFDRMKASMSIDKTKSKASEKPESHGDVRNDIKWIKGTGWTIAGLFAAAFMWLLTWYLPREFETHRQLIQNDISKLLIPISQDIAVLKTQVNDFILKLMKEKLNAKGPDLKTSLETVADIAKEAREKQIEADSKALGEIGVRVIRIGDSSPPVVSSAAWQATTELLNYRSFLTVRDIPDISGALPVTQSPVPFGISLNGHALPPYPGYPYPAVPVNMNFRYLNPVVPVESSALLESLDQQLENRASKQGPTYFVVESKGFEIATLRHAIHKSLSGFLEDGVTIKRQEDKRANRTSSGSPQKHLSGKATYQALIRNFA